MLRFIYKNQKVTLEVKFPKIEEKLGIVTTKGCFNELYLQTKNVTQGSRLSGIN